MFTTLKEIQAFIEECDQKRFDLDNEEVWSKTYLPATRSTEVRGNYEGKVVFEHVQIRLVASNEPLMGCGPLPDWLRDKLCIYALDALMIIFAFGDALPYTNDLPVVKKKRVQERNHNAVLNLAREYYVDSNLKKKGGEAYKTC